MDATKRPKPVRTGLYWVAMGAVVLLVVLHFNLWLGARVEPVVAGLPIGFLYHAVYCLAAIGVLSLLFRAIWPPRDPPVDSEER